MVKGLFDLDELDMADFEEVGIARDGKLLLEDSDLEALLSGRRTSMTELKDLYFDGFHISSLNAKLSLKAGLNGKPELYVHPLYKEKLAPEFLTEDEIIDLEEGRVANLEKTITSPRGAKREVLVEFDEETNEYLVSDIDEILAPDFVNGEELGLEQKARYRKGKEVELEDGTKFQYAGKEREGLRSNKIALIASIVVDGGISFLLYQGLNALFGQKHDAKSEQLSDGYRKAFSDLKMSEGDPEEWLKRQLQNPEREHNRGYSRGGTSR
jgi:hypothetical protein